MTGWGERILRFLNGRALATFGWTSVVLGGVVLMIAPLIFRADSTLFLEAVLFGLAAGWLAGRIPLPARAAAAANAALGMDFVFFVIGRLDVPLRSFVGRSLTGLAGLLPQFRGAPFDAGLWLSDAYHILRDPVSVVGRFVNWIQISVRGGDFFDPVASAMFWSLLFIVVGSFAGWTISAGRKPLAAVLPAVLLLGVVFVRRDGDWHLAVVAAGLALLLAAAVEHSLKEQDWDRRRMGYSTGLRWDLLFSAAPIGAALLAGAYILPSISLDEITRWVREQTQPTVATTGGTGEGFNPHISYNVSNPSEVEAFPYSHFLGAGPKLTDDVVMQIVTGESMIWLPGAREPVAPHHYWKAMAYDLYTGSGWLTSPTVEKDLQAETALHETFPAGTLLHQIVSVRRDGMGPVYAAGETVRVYRLFRVVWRSHEDVLGILVPGAEYEADSVYLAPDEGVLRAAGTDYPDWILDRYLQLPGILPPRIHLLARDLTAAQPTPYDQALAIQNYLRNEMTYSLEIGAPPYRTDVVEYFLFDSKTGFCDYFASAMVVLARAAGIPARLAMGFATGTFDQTQGMYTVVQSDSHAWPELYFPGIGWVEFEPTASMPVFQRAAAVSASTPDGDLRQEDGTGGSTLIAGVASLARRLAYPALIALLSAPLVSGLWILLSPFRLWLLPPADAVRTAYRGLVAHGRRQGVPFRSSTTPVEFAARLAERHPGDGRRMEMTAGLYSRMTYGEKAVTRREKREVAGAWAGVDRRMWRAWLLDRLRLSRTR